MICSMDIVIDKQVAKKIIDLHLIKPFKKAVNFFRLGHLDLIDFKLRKPKNAGVYQFRINKQYRAFGVKVDNYFRVYSVSDHQ